MNVKELYQKGKEISIKAGIETAKYLSGYNIHKEHVKQRQNIIETTENNIGKRVLKLSLNYTGEALREVVRCTPLVIEGWIAYKYATDKLPLPLSAIAWAITSAPIRLLEAEVISSYEKISENKKNKKELEAFKMKLQEERIEYEQIFSERETISKKLDATVKELEQIVTDPNFDIDKLR